MRFIISTYCKFGLQIFGSFIFATGVNSQVHHFLITDTTGGPLGSVAAGVPLWIQVVAVDSINAPVTSFTGTVVLAADSNMASGFGTTPPFSAGALDAHAVTFSRRGAYTITATRTGGIETGASNPVSVTNPVLSARVFLQGPFSSGAMSAALASGGNLALQQPFNRPPWNYAGNENLPSAPAGVVDWVLIEARTSTSAASIAGRRAALVLQNGSLADTGAGIPGGGIRLPVPAGSYHIVVRHRNHAAVMSSTPRPLNAVRDSCDLTVSPSRVFGGGAVVLPGGAAGLRAGDYSTNGFIDASDFVGPDNELFNSGYRDADLNVDGFIDAADFIHPDNNVFTGSTVPE